MSLAKILDRLMSSWRDFALLNQALTSSAVSWLILCTSAWGPSELARQKQRRWLAGHASSVDLAEARAWTASWSLSGLRIREDASSSGKSPLMEKSTNACPTTAAMFWSRLSQRETGRTRFARADQPTRQRK